MLRKILPLTLLAGSITVAALIFFAKTPGEIPPGAVASKTNEPLPTLNAPAAPDAASQDAIKNIGSKIAKEIIDNNPDGPVSTEEQTQITAINPDEIAQKLLQDGSAVDYSKFNPVVKLSDLHILPGTDKNLAEAYLKNAAAIADRNFSGISSDFVNATEADLRKLVAAYQKTLSELYSLNVPANLADIHMEKIRLFTFQKNLFENVSNYKSDPMAALISLRLFDKAYNDLSALDDKIEIFAIKNNLQI